jgi:hypothetical protein
MFSAVDASLLNDAPAILNWSEAGASAPPPPAVPIRRNAKRGSSVQSAGLTLTLVRYF